MFAASSLVKYCLLPVATRILAIFLLWILAPPLTYVFLAWIFLRDCDFTFFFQQCWPAAEEDEREYFREKVCWVTGASSGIGRALAVKLAQRGAYVILSARSQNELEKVAQECQRAFLVSEIRTFRHTESSISKVVEEVSDIVNTRVLVLPMDLLQTHSINKVIRSAISWRGKVDMLFNNAGISQRSILPDPDVDTHLFKINFFGPMALVRGLISTALQPVPQIPSSVTVQSSSPKPNAKPYLRFPQIEKMSTMEFATFQKKSLVTIVRQISLDQFHSGARAVKRSKVAKFIRQFIWGPEPDYNRTFHIVNTCSIFNRLPKPGRAAYGAAKTALAYCCDVTKMELEGLIQTGSYATEFVVTNCLIGLTKTNFLRRAIIGNKLPEIINENADTNYTPTDTTKTLHVEDSAAAADATSTITEPELESKASLEPQYCAELILTATYNKRNECWIAKQPILTYVYLQYYIPWLWNYLSYRFFQFPEYQKMAAYNEQRGKELVHNKQKLM